jgi:hypothetical protein
MKKELLKELVQVAFEAGRLQGKGFTTSEFHGAMARSKELFEQILQEDVDQGLKLWKEWFDFSGSPWESDSHGYGMDCFFCGEEHPDHSTECVFVRAQNLFIHQENFFDAVRNDAEMNQVQKDYWLALEPKEKK